MAFKPYREASKTNWGAELKEGEKLDRSQIQLGAVLRIADAVEKMAENYDALLSENGVLRQRCNEQLVCIKYHQNQIRGLKGRITKLKNK
jgi:hypothetical protein